MGVSEAVSIFAQAVILAVGIQLIGWAKWRARLAEEAWKNREGPADVKLVIDLQREVDATRERFANARRGLESAAAQLHREAQ